MAGWARRRTTVLVATTCSGLVAFVAAIALGRPGVAAASWLGLTVSCALLALAGASEHAEARDSAVATLTRVLAAKDPYTGEHTERVARYSAYIGEELGLSSRRLRRLRQAALLHDVGKLAVPVALLNKPGSLTEQEFRRVQHHAHACDDILGRIDALRPLAAAAAGHHRRFDGGGYGSGDRSLHATVVAVADAYDAMTSTRAYRRALPQAVAFEELRRRAGTQFAPAAVEALIAAVQRRGERHGLGHEDSVVVFDVDPPRLGVGSAGLAYRSVVASLRERSPRR